MWGRRSGLSALALLAGTACGGGESGVDVAAHKFAAAPAGSFSARVVRVVDGDTLVARRNGREVRVRLIAVDTPELGYEDRPAECFADEATAVLARLLPEGVRVRAKYQRGGKRDQYGRDLWDVWTLDGRFVQAVLVRRGAAEARAYPPHLKYVDRLEAIERAARAGGAGRWGDC